VLEREKVYLIEILKINSCVDFSERDGAQLVTAQTNSGVLSADQHKKVKAAQEQHQSLLRIPRR
jgi:hypothetical protein